MAAGDLYTTKTWAALLGELRDELRKWRVTDYILPTQDETNRSNVVKFLYVAPRSRGYTTVSCGRWAGPYGNWKEKNLYAIVDTIRFLRMADQRGVAGVVAQASKAFLLTAGGETQKRDPYTVFGLPTPPVNEPYTRDVLTAIYRGLAFKYHPDNRQTGDEAKFKELQQAAQELGVK